MSSLLEIRPKALILLPAWRERNADEEAWISALLRQLGRSLGATIVYDPGFPGVHRNGLRFSHRHWRDFHEQCKEAIFENPIEVVVAVGEAAKAENLDILSGWAPNIPRVSLFLDADLARPGALRLKSISDCSDLVLYRGDWKSAGGREACVGFIREPEDVIEAIRGRFSLGWLRAAEPKSKGPVTLDIFARQGAGARERVKRLIHGLGRAARARYIELDGSQSASGGGAFWNQAFRSSRADYLVFLDELLWLPDKTLARMLEYFKMGSALAVVSAASHDAADSKEARRLASLQHMPGGHRECGRFLHAHCWMLRRKALRQTGLLDERFQCQRFAFYDYGFRLRQAGFRLFTATDIAAWRVGAKAHGIGESAALAARDLELLEEKWCGNGIRAILKLSRRPPGGRNAAVVRAGREDSSALGAWVRQGAFSENVKAGSSEWPDYQGIIMELKDLINESRRENEHRNDNFHKDMNRRHDRLSRDFWKMANQLEDSAAKRVHALALGDQAASLALRQENKNLRREMDERHDRLSRDFWSMSRQVEKFWVKHLSALSDNIHAAAASLQQQLHQISIQQKAILLFQNGMQISSNGVKKNATARALVRGKTK